MSAHVNPAVAAGQTAGVHYENFPVASWLMPARLRPAVRVIYAFARSADDLADEGSASAAERLGALQAYADELNRIERGEAAHTPLGVALAEVVARHRLSLEPLRDLLSAFAQDVTVRRYADNDHLMDYCRRSANPVGRLMLALYGQDFGAQQALRLHQSDCICSALQLSNFWQDVASDWQRGRVYLPADIMARFGVQADWIGKHCELPLAARTDPAYPSWRALMRHQCQSTRALMREGAPLARALRGRIGLELRLVVQGGLRILDKIEAVDFDVFARRPTVGGRDAPLLAWRALTMRP